MKIIIGITQARLKEKLSYDPETGDFTWIDNFSSRARKGCVAGSVCRSDGYIYIRFDKKLYAVHRLAWLFTHGYFPQSDIDHKDGIRTNNRLENLRCVTRSENNQNQRRPHAGNSSGYLGVSRMKNLGKWAAEITVNKKRIRLGYFEDVKEAAEAYLTAKKKYHPMSTL
jgi:hypothetical protein